jgi:hypothetical protein
VGRRAGRGHLATEHGNLVAERDNLDCQVTVIDPTEAHQ